MLAKVLTATHFGLETIAVVVEVNVSKKGFPGFNIIGLPNKAVDEARERVKTALSNSGFEFPQAKVVVNLAPADIPKEGSNYDLPIAVGIMAAMGMVNLPEKKSVFYGELSLDGGTRHTKGVFLLALFARKKKIRNVFAPSVSINEAKVVDKVNIYPVSNLMELVEHLNGGTKIIKVKADKDVFEEEENDLAPEFDFNEIVGQVSAKRALEIAAAGGHNVFMQGPPGSGKTMLARAMAGILPALTIEESLEVTKIYSVTGNILPGEGLIRKRPFRSCHHTVSRIGLIGGGTNPHPGEISLAHRGVLFLDEFPEFSRSTLEALRQPLEDGKVQITRVAGSVEYPARMMLVSSANPCPCGYLGDSKRECKCSPRMIMKYQSKLSGPLLDRIDLHINVPAVEVEKLTKRVFKGGKSESSEMIRKRIIKARKLQVKRFSGLGIFTNSEMKNKHIKEFIKIDKSANLLLKQAVNSYGLSARSYFRILKISQTIADLSESKTIRESFVAEALQYRMRVEN